MEVVDRIFGSLIPILVLVGIIAAIVALVRRRGGVEEEPGIGTVKRLYYYGLSFVALMVAASGIALLVDFVVERLFGSEILVGGETQLALGLALTLVGTPIWLLHWSFAQRALAEFSGEVRALSRKAYLYLVLGVSAAVTAAGLVSLLRWLLGADTFQGTYIALPLVWGGAWAFHWRVEDLEGQTAELTRSVRRLYVYITSLYALAMLAVGMGILLGQLLGQAYDALFAPGLLLPARGALWSDTTRTAVAIALVGGGLWWWHWYRVSQGDTESLLRQVYLYLFAILGGAATVVVSLSVLLFGVLQWLIGVLDGAGAAAHFRFLPGMVAGLVTGAGLWGYHWAVAQQEAHLAAWRLLAARRVYRYLVAALGLGTLAAGLVTLFSAVLGVLVPVPGEELVRTDAWRNPLALAVTLMVVGAPLWGVYWFGVQRDVKAGGAEERAVLSRRVFIYLVFGIAVLVTLGNLSWLLFMLFQGLLEGDLSWQVLQEARWSIGMLVMAGAVSVYYWLVLQEDRQAMAALQETPAAAPPVRKMVRALASEAAQPLVRRLEARLGYPIHLWRRLDPDVGAPTMTDDELSAIMERMSEVSGDQVLLTIDASGIQVIPYREG